MLPLRFYLLSITGLLIWALYLPAIYGQSLQQVQAFKEGKNGKQIYFCNKNFRFNSDQINFIDQQKNLQIIGNIQLQNDTISINADNLTAIETAEGFTIKSSSIAYESAKIKIISKPVTLAPCKDGLQEFSDDSVEYDISTGSINWDVTSNQQNIVLNGRSTVINKQLNFEVQGRKIDIDLSQIGKVNKINVENEFKMQSDGFEIYAQRSEIDLNKQQVVVVGNAQLQFRNLVVMSAERIELQVGSERKIIADKVQNNILYFR